MRLIIVRHGKAEGDSPTGADADRRLKPRGEDQARHLGTLLSQLTPPVAAIVASDAERARATAALIDAALGVGVTHDPRLRVDEPVSGLFDLVSERAARLAPAPPGTLVLVGHNPQLEHAVALIAGARPGTGAPLRTGEAVVMEVDATDPLGGGAELDRWRLPKSDE